MFNFAMTRLAAGPTIAEQFQQAIFEKDRWKYFVTGLGNTLKVTILALIVGVVIGVLIAVVRSAHDSRKMPKAHTIGNPILDILNLVCKLYLTVIRGTPVMVQLLIMNFVILKPDKNGLIWAAVITFGMNSGAYVAEIIRSGIMSVDPGQTEAGRSLGLNYAQTMRLIVIPQAIKNILPALGNELITLVKETSVCTVIGFMDLTKSGQIVQSQTYQALVPYLCVAALYLVIVVVLTKLLGIFERRLRESDRR